MATPAGAYSRAGALFVLVLCLCFTPMRLFAQGNFEIQVYPGQTVEAHHTMFELHSNFTVEGARFPEDGTLPTHHALHETIEITHGFTSWFETGFYIFTSAHSGLGWNWVGDHIRPRVAVPENWNWPVGLSLSTEIGYQRPSYSRDTWTMELRPIVDKQTGPVYLSFNPTLDRSFHGPEKQRGYFFAPNLKFGYDFTKKIAGGVEYYGSLGPILGFDAVHEQTHLIVPAIDLNLSPDLEFNAGFGIGVTGSTDHFLIKLILGRRINH